MTVCMYVLSLDFVACVSRNYVSRDTNMRVLRTHEGEETVETLKRRQLRYIFRKCADLLRQLHLQYKTSTWRLSECVSLLAASRQNKATANAERVFM